MTECDDRDPLDELAEEFLARSRRGDRPAVSEYAARHPERAGEVRDLLAALLMVEDAKSGSDATFGASGTGPRPDKPLDRLGDYRIVREVGRGGMGVVYEAEQESLGRCVALKVLEKRSLAAAEQVRRFHREARAAARLHHTNIVPVFGVGEHDGLHYYVMQFIRGPGLDKVLDEMRRLEGRTSSVEGDSDDVRTRVGRFDPSAAEIARGLLHEPPAAPADTADVADHGTSNAAESLTPCPLASPGDSIRRYACTVARIGFQVAEALQYAHEHGVLHRDIKPSNLLLDAAGTVWVTDFGLAKATEDDDLTRTGDLLGTLRYMAPERFDGRCDARSDVYALGLTLYEMLAGRPAFAAADREHLINQVTHTEPPRLRDLRRGLPRDLETIIHKAIERDPAHRYATAGAMARDLARFLADRPIEARRASPLERMARWSRRNPTPATLAATVALLLIAIAVGSTVAAVHLSRKHAEAVAAGLEARKTLWESYLAQARAQRRGGDAGRRAAALQSVSAASRLGVYPERLWELRDEAIACLALADLQTSNVKGLSAPAGTAIGFDAAFERYAYQDSEGRIAVARVGKRDVVLLPASPLRPVAFRFSPDGTLLAAKCDENGHAGFALWDVNRREVALTVPEGVEGDAFGFSPDGRWLAAGRRDGAIDLYDAAARRLTQRLDVGAVPYGLAFAPDGNRLAVTSLSEETAVQVRDLNGDVTHSFALPVPAYALAWHPDGRRLAAGGDDGRIFMIDLASHEREPVIMDRHQGAVASLAFHPDGGLLASASWDGTLRLWDVAAGESLVRAPCPTAGDLRFSPDGRLLGPGQDGPLSLLWRVSTGNECHSFIDQDGPIRATWQVAFRPDRNLLVTTGPDGVRFNEASTAKPVASLALPGTSSSAFSIDGSALFTGGEPGLLRWPVASTSAAHLKIGPPEPFGLSAGMPTGRICLAADGRTLAAVLDSDRGRGVIFDLEQPGAKVEIGPHPGLERLAFSPDARWLATGTSRGAGVKVWNARSGKLETELAVDGSAEVLFSPNGRWLVTGSGTEYRAWEVGAWRAAGSIERINTGGFPGKMTFSPDGSVLALIRSRSVVQLVDPETFEVLTTLVAPDLRNVASLAFSADGARLALTHNSRVTTFWDLRSVRRELAAIGLDLPRPLFAPSTPSAAAAPAVSVVPPPWLDLAQAGDAHAAAGRWDEALAAYSAALDSGDRNPRTWSRRASLLLVTGRTDEYPQTCRDMLAYFDGPLPPSAQDIVARTCVLAPDAVSDFGDVTSLAEDAAAGPQDSTGPNTFGAVLYRAGRFKEALAAFEGGLAARASGGTPYDWLFLAMTWHRLGRGDEARAWLERADAHQRTRGNSGAADWQEAAELRLLRDEAGRLLAAPPTTP